MSHITKSDTLESAILNLADGVGAAIEILAAIVNQGPDNDLEAKAGGIGYLLLLDEIGIYGTDIYILYRDKCQSDLKRLLLLLRATRQGVYSASKLKELAGDQFSKVSISDGIWHELGYLVR